MCQGIPYEIWCKKEFPYIKQCVEEIYSSSQGASGGSHLLDISPVRELITNLEEAFQLAQSFKKKKSNKKATNAVRESEPIQDDDLNEELQHLNMDHGVKTPKFIHRKQRNSLDSIRGLSLMTKASLANIKSVVSNLESDAIEILKEFSIAKTRRQLQFSNQQH